MRHRRGGCSRYSEQHAICHTCGSRKPGRVFQAGLRAQGVAHVNAMMELRADHIHLCIRGDILAMSAAKPTRIARPLAVRVADVLATLATCLSALTALAMIGAARPLMAVAWVLLATAALSVLVVQVGPVGDGRSVHSDDWGEDDQ